MVAGCTEFRCRVWASCDTLAKASASHFGRLSSKRVGKGGGHLEAGTMARLIPLLVGSAGQKVFWDYALSVFLLHWVHFGSRPGFRLAFGLGFRLLNRI